MWEPGAIADKRAGVEPNQPLRLCTDHLLDRIVDRPAQFLEGLRGHAFPEFGDVVALLKLRCMEALAAYFFETHVSSGRRTDLHNSAGERVLAAKMARRQSVSRLSKNSTMNRYVLCLAHL